MKTKSLQLLSLFIFIVLINASCTKDTEIKPVFSDAATSASAAATLQGFNVSGRQYDLYYGEKNRIDSVVASSGGTLLYVYKVTYNGQTMEAVNLWDGGEIVATNDQFTFDKKGNITSYRYTFYLPDLEEGISQTINVGYDNRGRITDLGGPLTYDQQSNVATWQNGGTLSQYTYDKYRNPLNAIDNLFVVFVEETAYWEYMLSKHNSITKTINGETLEYQNEYDKKKRLVAKKVIQNGSEIEVITFQY